MSGVCLNDAPACKPPRMRRRLRNTVWICPNCESAWVLRRMYLEGISWWEWRPWDPPASNREQQTA